MKTLLILLSIISFLSCDKKADLPAAPTTGKYYFSFYEYATLSTNEQVEVPQQISLLYIWKSDNKDFTFKNIRDLGYAFDQISNKSIKYDYISINLYSEIGDLLPGKYFVMALTDNTYPKYRYSYTNFEIIAGKVTSIKKIFVGRISLDYEIW